METRKIEWLLQKIELNEFRKSYWERKFLHISRESKDFYSSLLKFDQLDVLLRLAVFHQASCVELVRSDNGEIETRQVAQGRSHKSSLATIHEHYVEGYSILLNKLHQLWPSITEFCMVLQDEIRHRIGANLYVTPPNAQCFNPHFDTHDVFILQIYGSKNWSISESPIELPLEQDSLQNYGSYEQGDASEVQLNAGDFLYIPRGQVHKAQSSDNTSIHLTIGIHVLREVDIVKAAIDEISKELIVLRRSTSNGVLGDFDTPRNTENHHELLSRLGLVLSDVEKVNKIQSNLVDTHHCPVSTRFLDIGKQSTLSLKTKLKVKDNIKCQFSASAEECEIQFCGKWVRGPKFVESAFEYVVKNRSFLVKDLPDVLTDEGKVVTARRLLSEGLLQEI